MINDENSLIAIAIFLHTILIAALIVFIKIKKSRRISTILIPLTVELFALPILFLFLLVHYSPTTPLIFVTILVYSIISTYVFCLEIPGYILISRYDNKFVVGLTDVRTALVPLKYAFSKRYEEFQKVCSENDKYLKDSNLSSLVLDFEKLSNQLKNLNESFWELLLKELTGTVEFYRIRSKHPFPKLIEVLSLTGLSFLIAQFLHILLV